MKQLYNYMFHFNPHTENWYAIHRDKKDLYWNMSEAEKTRTFIHGKDLIWVMMYLIAEINEQKNT